MPVNVSRDLTVPTSPIDVTADHQPDCRGTISHLLYASHLSPNNRINWHSTSLLRPVSTPRLLCLSKNTHQLLCLPPPPCALLSYWFNPDDRFHFAWLNDTVCQGGQLLPWSPHCTHTARLRRHDVEVFGRGRSIAWRWLENEPIMNGLLSVPPVALCGWPAVKASKMNGLIM